MRTTLENRESDERFMTMALQEARKAGSEGEIPVGAVLVKGDVVLAANHNRCIEMNDPSAHAEMLVLRRGGEVLENYRLNDTVLYVTAEPCPMCVSAMIHARISRLVFGTFEPKFGAVKSRFKLLNGNGFNHRMKVEHGILEERCAEVLRGFFKGKREKGKK